MQKTDQSNTNAAIVATIAALVLLWSNYRNGGVRHAYAFVLKVAKSLLVLKWCQAPHNASSIGGATIKLMWWVLVGVLFAATLLKERVQA